MSFWESSFLWLEAVIAACAVGAACAVVGVYMILRRVVFLPAALSQISGLGVVLAFLLPTWLASLQGSLLLSAEVLAAVVTLVASLALGWMPEPRRLSRDAVLGVAYVVASALILIIADRIPQDSHDIKDILFGNAVAVETHQMIVAVAVSALVLSVHALLFRPFLFASFDPETAAAHRVPVRAVDAVLFLTVGLTIAEATKTIGAMPVFAFAVIPAAAGLCLFTDTRLVFVAAALCGAASAFLGYWISFVGSFPTGPCMAVVTSAFLVPAMLYSRIRRGRWC
ncbi:MAG: metal ABC transporter permease [Polyangiaceae bacterium]|jgi:zinc transport system permease protein|nr:metal ABC transporter permease [Polyangiaceae bacterium]